MTSKISHFKNIATSWIITVVALTTLQMTGIFTLSAIAKPSMTGEKFFPYDAPEIVGIEKWINANPQKIADLRGKVVLVDFWTYSCINCLRTLPHMNKLHEKYHDKGLVIIGVHAPEFDFEKNPDNVAKAVEKFNIRYAVAIDNDLSTWINYENRYWPAHYLINQEGKVVYTHFGEGAYDVMDNNVRALLAIDDAEESKKHASHYVRGQSPETYLGLERTAKNANETARNFTYPKEIKKHHWALQGDWKRTGEFVESRKAGDALTFNFNAKKVFLVMSSANGKEIEAEIFVNGTQAGLGKDVKNGVVKIKDSELYELVSLDGLENGKVEIKAKSAGLRAYAFTFGGK